MRAPFSPDILQAGGKEEVRKEKPHTALPAANPFLFPPITTSKPERRPLTGASVVYAPNLENL